MYKDLDHVFILNAAAINKKSQDKLRERILSACKDEGIVKEVFVSEKKGDIEKFASQVISRNRPVRIYACGGDGSLNIVANCAYGHDNVQIGAMPFGTGNDFIKSFTNTKYFSDIERQVKGEPIKVDCIGFDNKIVVNMINIGFDSMVAEKTEETKKLPLVKGPTAYILGVMIILKQMPFTDMEITIDGDEKLSGKYLLCAIANGAYCGSGFNALSNAVIDDGLIDVVAVEPMSRLKFVSIVGKYKKGTLLGTPIADKILTYRRCKEMKINFGSKMNICIDGEMYGSKGTEFRMINKAIWFSAPKGCEKKNK